MLQSINDKFKGWITWIIIIAVSAVFVFTGISYFFVSSGVSPQAVAKVGDQQISQQTYQQMLQQNTQKDGLSEKEIQKQTLTELVDRALLQQDAKSSGIAITQQMLSAAIFKIPAFEENGQYSEKRFAQIAKYYGGVGAIKSMIASNLLAASMINPIVQSQFVLPGEKSMLSALVAQKRTIHYDVFDAHKYEDKIKVTDQQLKSYYSAHKASYAVPEKVTVSYVKLSVKDFVSLAALPQEQIKAYYAQNNSVLMTPEKRSGEVVTFKKDAKDKDKIVQALKAKETLTKVQRQQVTVKPLPAISQSQAHDFAEFALFNLTKQAPVREVSENEYVVLKEIMPPQPMSFEQATPVIEKILKNRAAMAQFNSVLTSINSNSFKEVVKQNALKVLTSKPFYQGQDSNGIEGDDKLQQAVFVHNKSEGFISESQTSGLIFKVDQRTAKHVPDFDSVKDKVKKDYIMTQAKEAALKAAQDWQKTNKKEKQSQPKESKTVSRDDLDGLPAQMSDAIFKAGLNHYEIFKQGDKVWVFAVNKVIPGKQMLPDDIIENFYSTLESNDYVAALHQQVPVEINHKLING
ncbi:SurA N-terminal domain-containing protein [Facilibium subflavum]|uniref:SurA N-terminal domain-containing protein n=1 Tax=Facilibium subflavum TaxID=2219058 RepID=UPI000E6574A4|nr:SurA N-terminal domain-containing protein [Facilibium subflavum]